LKSSDSKSHKSKSSDLTSPTSQSSDPEFSLFLGCIAPNRYPAIESCTELVLDKLGIGYEVMEEASCCPPPGIVRSFDELTWLTLSARNLSLAEGREIITICNGCFSTLKEASVILKNHEVRDNINQHLKAIGREYRGDVEVKHLVEILYSSLDRIKEVMERRLRLRVGVHYGCHLTRPSSILRVDSPENPRMLDEIVEVVGAESVEYDDKMLCCGAGGGVRSSSKELALTFTRRKLESLKDADVDCVVNSCPFCHLQLDQGQAILRKEGMNIEIPVLHISQFIALSLNYDAGLHQNAVPSERIVEKLEEKL
jgi:heterodisulfide reductase subunit B